MYACMLARRRDDVPHIIPNQTSYTHACTPGWMSQFFSFIIIIIIRNASKVKRHTHKRYALILKMLDFAIWFNMCVCVLYMFVYVCYNFTYIGGALRMIVGLLCVSEEGLKKNYNPNIMKNIFLVT